MVQLKDFSFGAVSAVITGLAIVVGFWGAPDAKVTIITALVILALADNISDSFSIHLHHKSEREKWTRSETVFNFLTRFVIVLCFSGFVIFLSEYYYTVCSVIFGLAIMTVISYSIAKYRKVSLTLTIVKYVGLSIFVMIASIFLRQLILFLISKSF